MTEQEEYSLGCSSIFKEMETQKNLNDIIDKLDGLKEEVIELRNKLQVLKID